MILIIDNYDSFVFNVAQYVKESSDQEVLIKRNDALSIQEISQLDPSHIILSPGPKHPRDSGVCLDILKSDLATPILGICLGHQAMAYADGGKIDKLSYPMHGKTSKIQILDMQGIFRSLPSEIEVMRYHSLYVSEVSPHFIPTAKAKDGCLMAMRHKTKPRYGIQFHPESYFSQYGLAMIKNFCLS